MKINEVLGGEDNNVHAAQRDEDTILMNMEHAVQNAVAKIARLYRTSVQEASEIVWERLQHMPLGESVVSKSNLKKEAQRSKMGEKAADLTPHAQKVWAAKDFEGKKAAAHEMAKHFKVGGAENFVAGINKAKSPADIDKHVANALLKGEGKGAKLY